MTIVTDEVGYVEDKTIVLPTLPNGPTSIGDLWDCHQSASTGFNLFGKSLSSRHVRADTILEQQSSLTHVKGTKDKHKMLQVGGEVSLELAGLLTVSGGADYEKDEGLSLSEEELVCSYDFCSFVVRALPSAKEEIDPIVMEKLLNREIKATHVVVREVLGAKTNVSIKIKESKQTTKQDIKGHFLGKLAIGPITAGAKVTLGMLDTNNSTDFEKTIKIDSKPAIVSQPTSIKAMFEVVETIEDTIKQQRHQSFNSQGDENIYGVPIRYVLAPINQYLDTKVERLYVQIKENVIEDLTELLHFLRDIQIYPYLSKQILKTHRRLKGILLDSNNPLTQAIAKREQEMKTVAKESLEKISSKLLEYKANRATQNDLLAIANEIHAQLNVEKILEEAEEFARKARSELANVNFEDIEDSYEVSVFTNESDLQEWFQPSKPIKLMLKTGGGGTSTWAVTTLYEISPKLKELKIELGVALPCISHNEYNLTLKLNGKEHVYTKAEIHHVVRVLLLITEQEKPIATRFFTIYASQERIHLPFKENLQDLPSLINILKEVESVRVAESWLKTRDLCQNKNGSRWNFVISMEALDSVVESVKRFKYLRHILQQHKCEWTFGKFGIETYSEYSNAPLLFIFREGNLIGQCMDNLDLLILQEAIKDEESEKRLLPLLSPSKENLKKNCLIPEKAQFAFKVFQSFGVDARPEADFLFQAMNGFRTEKPDSNKHALRVLIRSLLLSHTHGMISSLGEILALESETLKLKLMEMGWVLCKEIGLRAPPNLQSEKLKIVLQSFVESQDPSYVRIQGNCKSLQACKDSANAALVETFIKAIVSEPTLPANVKSQIDLCKEMQLNAKIEAIVKEVENYLNSAPVKKYKLILQVIDLLEFKTPAEQSEFVANNILPSCLSKLAIQEEKYPGASKTLNIVPKLSDYYKNLEILAVTSFHPMLYSVGQMVDDLVVLVDSSGFSKFFRKLSGMKYTDEQKTSIFHESTRICTAIELNIKAEGLLSIVDWLPKQIQDQVSSLRKVEECYECPESFTSLDQVLSAFGNIIAANIIPSNFAKVLPQTLIDNPDIHKAFKDAKALIHWDAEEMYLTQAWDIETIETARQRLIDWISNLNQKPLPKPQLMLDLNVEVFEKTIIPSRAYLTTTAPPTSHSSVWTQLLGPNANHISPLDFLKVTKIQPDPQPTDDVTDGYIHRLLPLIIQRLKMWGVHTLTPAYLNGLQKPKTVSMSPLQAQGSGVSPAGPPKLNFGKRAAPAAPVPVAVNETKPISRLDILSCLYASCDSLVFQDIIRVISQFPVSLPFIIPNLKSVDSRPEFVCLASELRHIRSKWEVTAGTVKYNQLFSNPFKMIVALRVGTQKQGQPGKSSILNQVLASRDVFSSQGNPGSEHGKPLTLEGTVEFCILSQEIASSSLWTDALQSHYTSGKDEVLLLANLHGDSLKYPETVKVLKSFASSFIVFLMPMTCNELEDGCSKLEEIIECESSPDLATRLFHALVDPSDECSSVLPPDRQINTGRIASDSTSLVTRTLLREAINTVSCLTPSMPLTKEPNLSKNVKYSPDLTHLESQTLVGLVAQRGSRIVKSNLKLQQINPKKTAFQSAVSSEWQSNGLLRDVIKSIIRILRLPIEERLRALAHLDREISQISATASSQVLATIMALNDQKCRAFSLDASQQSRQEKHMLDTQINSAFEELDKITLGMEHLYREMGRIYQYVQSLDPSQQSKEILNVPSCVAETLIEGNAIEILDGDAMDICGPWFNAICHSICQKHPNLKVFVLSIIGLQSSGKSTLLNALFACKFAVSVGRCTRGLFMRLLFLEDDLAKELGVDAIVVLDTEGLGAPEKLNDPLSEQKDRLLATFAMSVSNLTLINVLGESLGDLTDILQIVIVTMARLEKAQISPDILMVQHLSERDGSKVMQGAKEFSSALDAAVTLTSKQDMDIGIQNCRSLQRLQSRVKSGQILNQFPPFKNGATVNAPPSQQYHESIVKLFNAILSSCKDTKTPQKFHQWHDVIQSYWDAVSSQNFALRFKNIREIQDFIDRGKSIQTVKAAVDDAFKAHRDVLEIRLRENSQKKEILNSILKIEMEKTLELIPHSCPTPCTTCNNALRLRDNLFDTVRDQNCERETQNTVFKYTQRHRSEVLKLLVQKVDALEIERGHVGDFDKIIEKFLKLELSLKDPNETLSDQKIQTIANAIWTKVKQEVSHKNVVPPAYQRILSEIEVEYNEVGYIRTDVQYERNPDFSAMDALDRSWPRSKKLEAEQVTELQIGLKDLTSKAIPDHKGYEAGDVRFIKDQVNLFLDKFQKNLKIKLLPMFKWKAHVFALIHFKRVARKIDENWNRNNNPSWILDTKKELYLKEIKIRLEHGFGLEAEGRVVGAFLLKAVRKLGQDQGDEAHERHVKDHDWLTGSENVRLRYFSDLAMKVERGDKSDALNHFRNPNSEINQWFTLEVNRINREKGEAKYKETVTAEFRSLEQDIRNKVNCKGILEEVQRFLVRAGITDYSPKLDIDGPFSVFQEIILSTLKAGEQSLEQQIQISNPASSSTIRSLLGCTESCFWCGALCWGAYGHHEDDGDTKKHHTCHQPSGLAGISDKTTSVLREIPCTCMTDTWMVYWSEQPDGLSWPRAKKEHFNHWMFTNHHKTEFNNLMKWFFLKLNEDIARNREKVAASQSSLQKQGFYSLPGISHIINTIRESYKG